MHQMPPLNWLRAFEAAARHLSFTHAANELGLSQVAVSKQVKQLELHLREPLFMRRARSLEMTKAAEAYYPRSVMPSNDCQTGPGKSLVDGVLKFLPFEPQWASLSTGWHRSYLISTHDIQKFRCALFQVSGMKKSAILILILIFDMEPENGQADASVKQSGGGGCEQYHRRIRIAENNFLTNVLFATTLHYMIHLPKL